MLVHHMIVESMFCYEILAFITLSTFAVSRFNGAKWTDSIKQKHILLKTWFTMMSSIFQSDMVLHHVLCHGFIPALVTLKLNFYWSCQSFFRWAIQLQNGVRDLIISVSSCLLVGHPKGLHRIWCAFLYCSCFGDRWESNKCLFKMTKYTHKKKLSVCVNFFFKSFANHSQSSCQTKQFSGPIPNSGQCW